MASRCVIWGSNTIRRQLGTLGLINSKRGVVTGQSLVRLIRGGNPGPLQIHTIIFNNNNYHIVAAQL